MKRLVMIVLSVLLAGCAAQQVTPAFAPEQPATRQLADARTRADLHTQLGAGYFELGNYQVALESLQEALRAEPAYGPAHNMLALVYMQLGEDALAHQSFARALQINPLDSDANNNYGWFLCQRKRYDEAMKYFMTALKNPLYQSPDKSYVNAGICSRERGDNVAARQLFEQALKLQPAQSSALYHLADMAFRRGQVGESKEFMVRYSRTGAPFSAEALWLALRIERSRGDHQAEASYGLQLRKNFPDSPQAQALLNRQYE